MSSNEIVIEVKGLSKCYQIYDRPRDRLKQFFAPKLQRVARRESRRYFREFWALRDVSFSIKKVRPSVLSGATVPVSLLCCK